MISIRIILDIKSKIFIRCQKWQRLVVYICSNPFFCHLFNNLVALFSSLSIHPDKIQVTTGLLCFSIVLQNRDIFILKCFIVSLNNSSSSLKKLRITSQLCQSKSSHDIRHVTLKVWSDNIIFPCSKLCLGKSIFRLSM